MLAVAHEDGPGHSAKEDLRILAIIDEDLARLVEDAQVAILAAVNDEALALDFSRSLLSRLALQLHPLVVFFLSFFFFGLAGFAFGETFFTTSSVADLPSFLTILNSSPDHSAKAAQSTWMTASSESS
jgi:hypothetical protein